MGNGVKWSISKDGGNDLVELRCVDIVFDGRIEAVRMHLADIGNDPGQVLLRKLAATKDRARARVAIGEKEVLEFDFYASPMDGDLAEIKVAGMIESRNIEPISQELANELAKYIGPEDIPPVQQ